LSSIESREHVTDDEHPDHQNRINRWPTKPGIISCQLGMHPTQTENRGDLANWMIVRHRFIGTKSIEKLFLVVIEPPHHGPLPSRIASQRRNHRPKKLATDFYNKIDPFRTLGLFSNPDPSLTGYFRSYSTAGGGHRTILSR